MFDVLFSYTTEILEIRADDPTLHVVVIPGNPGGFVCFWVFRRVFLSVTDSIVRIVIWVVGIVGVVLFYKEFLESLYELLGGTASVTGKTWVFILYCFG